MWLNDPDFLKDEQLMWTKSPELNVVNNEEIQYDLFVIDKTNSFTINIEYFSSWKRLYMALSLFVLYTEYLKSRIRCEKPLHFEQIQKAKNIFFNYV